MLSMLSHLKKYWLLIAAVILLTLCATMLELYLPTLMADVVDIGIVSADLSFIMQTGGWMIACSLLAILCTIISTFCASKVALGFSRDVRRVLFVHIEQFSLAEYERIGPASLITRATNDVKQMQDVVHTLLRIVTRAPLMLIGGIILAIMRDAVLSLIFLAALPLLVAIIYIISKKAIPLFTALQKRTDRLNLILREGLIGMKVVRAFNRVSYEKKRFQQANEAFRDTGIAVNKIMAWVFPLMLIVMNFTNIAIVWFASIRIDIGAMQVGNMMAFLQYSMMILMSLIMLSMAFIMIPRAQASAKRINEVLQTNPSIQNTKDYSKWEHSRKGVTFSDVTFYYDDAEKPALSNITFHANDGETTAIIGSTGSGKTTLVQLIPRFYDVNSGQVQLHGVDVRDVNIEQLRKRISYVPQNASLFTGTVAENVRFGKKEATDAEVKDALKIAQALPFVEARKDGIHSHIEQAGANVSGGQRQRLSIARALVKEADVYIFDDSFSALDYKTDAALRKALMKEFRQKATILIVAQRVSTVIDCDQIIVLDDGKIAGIGTHEQLLQENDVYKEIVHSQGKEEEKA